MKYRAVRDPDPYPAGKFAAELIDTEEKEGTYGPYLLWRFRVYYQGDSQVISGMTGVRFGSRSKEYQLVEALLGHAPREGEEIDLEALYGRDCTVELEVKARRNGNGTINNVINVYPADPAADSLAIADDETDDIPF